MIWFSLQGDCCRTEHLGRERFQDPPLNSYRQKRGPSVIWLNPECALVHTDSTQDVELPNKNIRKRQGLLFNNLDSRDSAPDADSFGERWPPCSAISGSDGRDSIRRRYRAAEVRIWICSFGTQPSTL